MANNLLTETELAQLPKEQRETYEWMIKRIKPFYDYPEVSYYEKESKAVFIRTTFSNLIVIHPDGTFN